MSRLDPPPLPESLRDLDVERLVGVPLNEVRRIVEDRGGNVQVVTGHYVSADLVRTRLRVHVVDGRVSEIVSLWL